MANHHEYTFNVFSYKYISHGINFKGNFSLDLSLCAARAIRYINFELFALKMR